MGKVTAKNAIILINGYKFSTFTTAYDAKSDAGKVDVTGFGDGGANYIPGMPSASLTADMLWDSDANSVHAALSSMPVGVVTIIPEGWILGNSDVSLPFMLSNYKPQGKPTDAIKLGTLTFDAYNDAATYGKSANLEIGWILQHGTITNTLTGSGFVDPTGAPVLNAYGIGTLHIWTPVAADTYVVKIQHSTSLTTGYADLITFTANGSARTVERQVASIGTINQYRRVIATRTGSAGNPFGFSVHFAYHL